MKPCTRCNGSGQEPDAIAEAAKTLALAISKTQEWPGPRQELTAAAAKLRDAARDRLDQREALLDEILNCIGDARDNGYVLYTHRVVQVPVADIQSWQERRQA